MAIYRLPVDITWTGPGSPGVNVWHLRTTTASGEPGVDLQLLVDIVHDFYTGLNSQAAGADSPFAAGTTFTATEAVDVETQEFAAVTWPTITSAASTPDAPPHLAVCIGWRTSIAARRGMGRTFLGPLSQTTLDDTGSIKPAWVTVFSDAASALVAASEAELNGGVAIWGLQNPAPSGTTDYSTLPHVARDVTGSRVGTQFAIMRSRRD